jgi:hypothetical protein
MPFHDTCHKLTQEVCWLKIFLKMKLTSLKAEKFILKEGAALRNRLSQRVMVPLSCHPLPRSRGGAVRPEKPR